MFLLEVEDREFGVMLEGIQRLVPQQFLDVVHVRPAPQQSGFMIYISEPVGMSM